MAISRRELLKSSGIAALTTPAFGSTGVIPGVQRIAKTKIKVGQIGTKHAHASGKMSTLRRLSEDYEVLGIVETDENRRRQMEGHKSYKGINWMSEEELLNVPGLQIVAVETAVRDLVPTAFRCLAAGKHIHLDKPAGESLSAFRRLLEQAEKGNLVVQMGYMFRYNPGFQFLFEAARQGWLGKIFEVHGVISKKVSIETRTELAEYPGGTMFELGCHLIDALVATLGKPDKVTAYNGQTRPEIDQLVDNQLAVFEYATGIATIRSALVEVDGQKRRQFTVCGDEGTIEIKPLEPPFLSLTLERPKGRFGKCTRLEVPLPKPSGRYDGDFFDLARIVRGEKAADYTLAHDLAVHECVLRASGVPCD